MHEVDNTFSGEFPNRRFYRLSPIMMLDVHRHHDNESVVIYYDQVVDNHERHTIYVEDGQIIGTQPVSTERISVPSWEAFVAAPEIYLVRHRL